MKTIVIINDHIGSKMSFCGADYNGYRKFDTKELASQFIKKNNFDINNIHKDKELNFNLINLKTLEYNDRIERVEELFTKGIPEELNLYWDKQEELENQKRKSQGYIYCKKLDDMTAEDYKGSLNKALTEDVIKYINSRVVAGYMGHSARTYNHDKVIEEVVDNINFTLDNKPLDKWKALGIWLTSTNARHFMDSVEDDDIETFKEKVKDNIYEMVLLGFIYNLPEHHGSLKDTEILMNMYKDRIKIA